MIDASDLVGYLLDFGNVLHFDLDLSDGDFFVCGDVGELSECVETHPDLWFEDDMGIE